MAAQQDPIPALRLRAAALQFRLGMRHWTPEQRAEDRAELARIEAAIALAEKEA